MRWEYPAIKVAAFLAVESATACQVSVKVTMLAEGVVKAMFLAKLRPCIMISLLLGTVGAGAGTLAYRAGAAEQGGSPTAAEDVNASESSAESGQYAIRAPNARTSPSAVSS